MIDLASTRRRCGHEHLGVGQRDLLDHHVLLFDARRFGSAALDGVERDVHVRVLVGGSGRVEELAQLHEPVGA